MSEHQFTPTGPPRPNQIYVSWQLFKALGYAARKGERTREDVAELVLRTFVAHEHPEILAWLEKRDVEEREFLKTLSAARERQEKFTPATEDVPT